MNVENFIYSAVSSKDLIHLYRTQEASYHRFPKVVDIAYSRDEQDRVHRALHRSGNLAALIATANGAATINAADAYLATTFLDCGEFCELNPGVELCHLAHRARYLVVGGAAPAASLGITEIKTVTAKFQPHGSYDML